MDPYLTQYEKINPKQATGLNKRANALKCLKQNIEKDPYDLKLGNDFLDMIENMNDKRKNK